MLSQKCKRCKKWYNVEDIDVKELCGYCLQFRKKQKVSKEPIVAGMLLWVVGFSLLLAWMINLPLLMENMLPFGIGALIGAGYGFIFLYAKK